MRNAVGVDSDVYGRRWQVGVNQDVVKVEFDKHIVSFSPEAVKSDCA